jgi:nicotinamidase-related amidase
VEEIDIKSEPAVPVFEKRLFSMLTPAVDVYLREECANRKHAVLFGIEAHVCVLQTALDLLERDYTVHLVVDGVSSQRELDRTVGIERARQSGALVTSCESVLFQLMGSADHPSFKAVSALVTEKRPEPLFSKF